MMVALSAGGQSQQKLFAGLAKAEVIEVAADQFSAGEESKGQAGRGGDVGLCPGAVQQEIGDEDNGKANKQAGGPFGATARVPVAVETALPSDTLADGNW